MTGSGRNKQWEEILPEQILERRPASAGANQHIGGRNAGMTNGRKTGEEYSMKRIYRALQ